MRGRACRAPTSLRHAADVAVALAPGETPPRIRRQRRATARSLPSRSSRPRWRRRRRPCAGCSPAARSATRRSSRSSRAACACSSNAPADGAATFDARGRFDGHVFLDLGDDDYTRGRPHPMIDPSLRDAAVRTQGADPHTAAILFDVVLGFGSHDDPARGLGAGPGGRAARGARAGAHAGADRPCLRNRRRPAGQGSAGARSWKAAGASSSAATSRRRCWRRSWRRSSPRVPVAAAPRTSTPWP